MLPENMAGEEIKVHIKSVKNEGVLVIQRIAGCNAEGKTMFMFILI